MIRKLEKADIDEVMHIWLESNIKAHFFVPESYWREQYEAVKEMIPKADVLVYETDGEILGFIGLTDDYVAGIFVAERARGEGIGKKLLDAAKKGRTGLTLYVYEKNVRAVRFYEREGFAIREKKIDEAVGELELFMNWLR